MIEQIKKDLFTIHGIVTTVIHLFLAVGVLTSAVGFNVYVMGNDPMGNPVMEARKK